MTTSQSENGGKALPNVTHILECALYVADLDRSQAFYQRVFGFPLFLRDQRMAALGVPGQQVLLLFHLGDSTNPASTPFGLIPPHDASGVQHMAYAVPADQVDAWTVRLADCGIAVESRLDWPSGSTAIYFRDPDGHSIELATPKLWPNYGRDGS